MKPWASAAVALLIALAAGAVAYGQVKEKVTTLEKRQDEDRAAVRQDQREIKQDVKDTREAVQRVLIKLEAMEAVQRAERRGR